MYGLNCENKDVCFDLGILVNLIEVVYVGNCLGDIFILFCVIGY